MVGELVSLAFITFSLFTFIIFGRRLRLSPLPIVLTVMIQHLHHVFSQFICRETNNGSDSVPGVHFEDLFKKRHSFASNPSLGYTDKSL